MNPESYFNLIQNTYFLFYLGSSGTSKMVKARTKGQVPEAPPLFQFVTTNSSQATLYLTQWESGGCPITHFTIKYKSPSDITFNLGKSIKFPFSLYLK